MTDTTSRMHGTRRARLLATALATLALPFAGPAVAQNRTTEAQPAEVSVRAFGDLGLVRTSGEGASFALGQLDAFVTASLSDRFSVLIETVAEANDANEVSTDVERAIVRYAFSDKFRVGAGRFHTTIGFYNTAYHHGAWFQTAASRPTLFAFEDDHGILPIHQVGLMLDGRIPSRGLGLRWFAEVGNGRPPAGGGEIQNMHDADARKSVVLAISSQPDRVQGLTVGASFYHDRSQHTPATTVDENIVTAHAVVLRQDFEWLTEVARIAHGVTGGGTTAVTYGGYTQLARRVGPVKPYLRIEGFNAGTGDPLFDTLPDGRTFLVGVRRELAPAASVKFEVTSHREGAGPWTPGAKAQVAFAF